MIPDRTRATWPRILLIGFAAYLILTFLWRLLVPAHELPVRSDQVMTMLLDALTLAGLVGLRARLRQETGADATAPPLRMLFALGVAAGLGLFAVRLTGEYAWWSGHLRYAL